LGADHLGPYAWQGQPAAQAMKNVETLARLCVEAGFRKIHLDTGVACADDPGPPLPLETAALRAARLCRAAEAAVVRPDHPPMYVIGNDVPPPGGGLTPDAQVHVTSPDQLDATLQAYRRAFERAGVRHAWERVMAVVVQPGVEFGDQRVAVYDPEQAVCLSAAHACLPGAMTFEIHAADYQPPEAMDRMVADHFVLLKVGPCLTFAFRRALYGLESIERQLPGIAHRSNLTQVMEDLMTADPQHWQGRYAGDEAAARYLRHHSLRDRIRYYWSRPAARQAVDRLMDNLKQSLPDELIERHLPEHHADIQRLGLNADPGAIVHLYISEALAPYVAACGRSLL
ncbi:MAG: tagatose-bisphosphate aldolase, partial [Desulfatitalea sp.]|nr:class II D-tagatose-bisphosphate aldolase, non-catalytic subunit [Desulfatitalea sp.]NNJ99522.1 tagatose-bisphosphate aldolase [Desulfatitalea sp.]